MVNFENNSEMEDLGPLPGGDYHMYRQKNAAGGYTYYSDEFNQVLFDEIVHNPHDVLAAVVHSMGQEVIRAHTRKKGPIGEWGDGD